MIQGWGFRAFWDSGFWDFGFRDSGFWDFGYGVSNCSRFIFVEASFQGFGLEVWLQGDPGGRPVAGLQEICGMGNL